MLDKEEELEKALLQEIAEEENENENKGILYFILIIV